MANLLIRGGLLLMLYYQHVNAISFVSPPTPKTCKFLQDGRYYSGKAAIAASGKTCRSWSTNETFSAAAFGNTSWSDLRNYCRGPLINGETNMPDGPWCFTTEGAQYCDVPFCSEETFKSTRQCVLENGFMTYAGNATADEECLLWTDDLVQSQGFELWQFPGSYSWEEMVNYCRNPDNHPYPWCYSKQEGNNGKLKKLECQSIPSCSNRCRLTEASLEYVGKKDRSETRKPCVPAQLAFQVYSRKRRRGDIGFRPSMLSFFAF
ncbi:PLG [Bugula neritina]|uniref:PLG n=1 Tax=Bugula neritina TaxID=10212 RepID=A0A7J7JUX4_BUGNE|nr:PLG [Bugula neritina]